MKCHDTENWGVECDHLSENAPHKLVYLRTWSLDMELFRNAWVVPSSGGGTSLAWTVR